MVRLDLTRRPSAPGFPNWWDAGGATDQRGFRRESSCPRSRFECSGPVWRLEVMSRALLLAACGLVTSPAFAQTSEQVDPLYETEELGPMDPTPGEGAPPSPEEVEATLGEYGGWLDHAEHGRVWRPYNMASDWRPYSVGHWERRQADWVWVSDFAWGWIPFHYGRWVFTSNYGWLWIPGSQWAPAWVVWGEAGTYARWAPLPPGAGWRGTVFATTLPSVAWVYCPIRAFRSPLVRFRPIYRAPVARRFRARPVGPYVRGPRHVRGAYRRPGRPVHGTVKPRSQRVVPHRNLHHKGYRSKRVQWRSGAPVRSLRPRPMPPRRSVRGSAGFPRRRLQSSGRVRTYRARGGRPRRTAGRRR
jgi:hypothetical protein